MRTPAGLSAAGGLGDGGSLLRGTNRTYVLFIVIVVVVVLYTLLSGKHLIDLLHPTGGVSSPSSCPACHCECAFPADALRQLVAANPAAAAASCPPCEKADSKALVAKERAAASSSSSSLEGGWSPTLTSQTYGSTPRVVQVGGKPSYHQFVRSAYPPVGPEKGSIWDGSWYDTPIAYGTPLVPEREDDGFPKGFVPRPACQRETDVLQNYIYENQHPANCKTAKLWIRRHTPTYGLFAGLGLSSNYLFMAAALGRTLIDVSPNSYFTGNCAAGGLECVFLPITNCTMADVNPGENICNNAACWDTARVITIDGQSLTDYLPCAPTEFPVQRCKGPKITRSLHEILPGLKHAHGEHFFQTEFSRYLTRPNRAQAQFTADIMADLKLDGDFVAVQVRHGDKQEGIQFPTQAYGVVVKRVIQITGIKTVFIGSDDKSVYEELPKWIDLPGVRFVWMNDPNDIVFSHNQAATKGQNTIGKYLMAQVAILVQAHAYVGTRTSNAGQIVYAMQANDCTKQKIAYDMYGDLFYNSWYCRGDIVHAGREWMCALKRPGKDEGLIWKWGGAQTECI